MTITVTDALNLAIKVHKGQIDECGEEYIIHIINVASRFEDKKGYIAALLRDTLEDCNETNKRLIESALANDPDILEAVRLLAEKDDVPYMLYIDSLKNNKLATGVKLIDLSYKTDSNRYEKVLNYLSSINVPTEKFACQQDMYEKALEHLLYC